MLCEVSSCGMTMQQDSHTREVLRLLKERLMQYGKFEEEAA